jgi:geranylgeranyl pyrophosphate synthase
LQKVLPPEDQHPVRLHRAMRYAVLGGGKRIRPLLVYATGLALDVPLEQLDGAACAVEMVHAYSLVHDDLPAMDDDDLRRGRPTCHKAFDEATAILAGDALQAMAFEVLSKSNGINPATRLQMVDTLARASGSHGMAGGQAIDLASVGKTLTIAELENMHTHKTGALIRASALLGVLAKQDCASHLVERLDQYGKRIGLAFQIQDDILDVEGQTEVIGKTCGADTFLNKPTYPSILGTREAKLQAQEMYDQALQCLSAFDYQADLLRYLSAFMINRDF